MKNLSTFRLPNFDGNLISIEVVNNAMPLSLPSGSLAFCKVDTHESEIESGKIYAFFVGSAVFLRKLEIKKSTYKLISENENEPNFEITKSEATNILLVVQVLETIL
jgi:phage repressor protein C with HTH and peptisase S24 domain